MIRKFLLTTLLLSVFSLFSYAQENNIEQDTIVKELLELSGLKKQIEQLPSLIQASIARRQREVEPKASEVLSKAAAVSFQPEALYQIIVEHFKNNFDQGYIVTMLNWLQSPLSKKLTQLEVQASDAASLQNEKDFAAQLQNNPPLPNRLALVQRLDEAGKAAELSIEIQLGLFQAMAKAIDPTLPSEKRLKEGQLEQMLNTMKTQMQIPIKNFTLVSFLYTYRSVSDEELGQYIAIAESDAGKWFSKVSMEALKKALVLSGEEFAKRVVEESIKIKEAAEKAPKE